MGFRLFKPRSAKEKNYMEYENNLYIALETLKAYCKQGKKEKNYYVIQSSNNAYRKAYDLSYSLVRFYTKVKDESKEFMFKRNFLLSKTRGIFSEQKKEYSALSETFYLKCEQVDALPDLYFKMFHLDKSFGKKVTVEIDEDAEEAIIEEEKN